MTTNVNKPVDNVARDAAACNQQLTCSQLLVICPATDSRRRDTATDTLPENKGQRRL